MLNIRWLRAAGVGIVPLAVIALLTISWGLAPVALAGCDKDASGEVYCGKGMCLSGSDGTVWCSRFKDGDAMIARDGVVLCGRGRCTKDRAGEIFCSTEEGGAVLKDRNGRVRCLGRCERATVEYCESTVAGTSK